MHRRKTRSKYAVYKEGIGQMSFNSSLRTANKRAKAMSKSGKVDVIKVVHPKRKSVQFRKVSTYSHGKKK